MDERQMVRTSKFLSQHLRHRPERLGLTLEPGGCVAVAALLDGCARAGMPLTRTELQEVVARNDKQRFSFDATGEMIRANQGHSVAVDLQLEAAPPPPPTLFHGTAEATAARIEREGLRRMGRQHVHLSPDTETARRVGARHGRPAVFAVDAAAMVRDRLVFYQSANGVWLTDQVPPTYLRRL